MGTTCSHPQSRTVLTKQSSMIRPINMDALQEYSRLSTPPLDDDYVLVPYTRKLSTYYKTDITLLGKGHYADVYKGVSKAEPHQKVAVKMINKQKSKNERLKTEVELMMHVSKTQKSHRNIVSLIDVFENETHLILVLELVGGGELFYHLIDNGAYSERAASRYIHEVCSAVSFLHSRNIVHRDLKPENLLLTSKNASRASIKIADFGLAKHMESDFMSSKYLIGF